MNILKNIENKSGKDVEIGNLSQVKLECKIGQAFWKTAWWFLKKLKIVLPFDPEILLSFSTHRSTKNISRQIHIHKCSQQLYS